MGRLVRYFSPRACDTPALEQAARFGALKAAAKFEPARSEDFGAFAKMTIKDAVKDEIDRICRQRLPLLDDLPNVVSDVLREEFVPSPAFNLVRAESLSAVTENVRTWVF